MKNNGIKPIPEGYHTITPYLVVKKSSQLVSFLKNVFDARENYRTDNPDGTIRHAEYQVGDSRLMLSEATDTYPPMPAMLMLYVTNCDATYKKAVDAGARSLREPQNEYYGDRMAGVLDDSGNQWWIATHVEDLTPEEMKKREAEMAKK